MWPYSAQVLYVRLLCPENIFKVSHNITFNGQNRTAVHRTHVRLMSWNYQAVAIYRFWLMTKIHLRLSCPENMKQLSWVSDQCPWQYFQADSHNFKVNGQNDPMVHRLCWCVLKIWSSWHVLGICSNQSNTLDKIFNLTVNVTISRSIGQNDSLVHRSHVKLIFPYNLKLLPLIVFQAIPQGKNIQDEDHSFKVNSQNVHTVHSSTGAVQCWYALKIWNSWHGRFLKNCPDNIFKVKIIILRLKVKSQNDPTVQKSQVKMCAENMKRLPCIVFKPNNGMDRIFNLKVKISRQRSKWPHSSHVISQGDMSIKYEAVAVYSLRAKARKKDQGEGHNFKVKGQNIPVVHRYHVRLICSEYMKQLPGDWFLRMVQKRFSM